MKTKFYAIIAILALCFALNAQALKITEVGILDDAPWAEIYNDSPGPVDIAFIKLTDLDGVDEVIATSPTTLLSGQHALVHWANGQDETDAVGDINHNGLIDLYLSDSYPTKTDDQLALNSGVYLDAVCWTNGDQTVASTEIDDVRMLFDADQWPNAEDIASFNQVCVNISSLTAGMSLSRYLDVSSVDYADTNTKNDWYLSDNPTPGFPSDKALSVVLSSFVATATNDAVVLRWQTESETNNLGFRVYRNSKQIGFVKSADRPYDYQFVDDRVQFGKTYEYFIEDVDFSGNRKKSQILEITVGKKLVANFVKPKFALFQNYPNPFNPETWIPYQLAQDCEVKILIRNILGQVVWEGFNKKQAGYNQERLNALDLSSGVYFYTLQAGEFSATRKMVILK
ncbi:MAG: T9SS type A sorting domain-containing protein [bacterium]